MAKRLETMRKNGEAGIRYGYVDIITRAEAELLPKLKTLSAGYGGTLTNMYAVLLRQFFFEQPWVDNDFWRKSKGLTERKRDIVLKKTPDGNVIEVPMTLIEATGWIQINLRVEAEIADHVKLIASQQGESVSTVLYTALFWWVFVKNTIQDK